jgi:rhamnogalacturonyl hydrolase YesR
VHRVAVRLGAAQRDELEAHLARQLEAIQHGQHDDGSWTRILVTMVDLQDRREAPGTARQQAGSSAS